MLETGERKWSYRKLKMIDSSEEKLVVEAKRRVGCVVEGSACAWRGPESTNGQLERTEKSVKEQFLGGSRRVDTSAAEAASRELPEAGPSGTRLRGESL
jgi:hypothetical protein